MCSTIRFILLRAVVKSNEVIIDVRIYFKIFWYKILVYRSSFIAGTLKTNFNCTVKTLIE